MANVITRERSVSRRRFLSGVTTAATIGLPPLTVMFNAAGSAYAAPARTAGKAIPTRFVVWFNGNGIVERYWIPAETGADFVMTPCLAPLAQFRNDIHIVTGLDNPA